MRPAFQLDDEGARRVIRTALDESLIVEAAAGTGKTSELVRRIVAVLQQGLTTIDRIVAVTFTRKAAGELKLRLRQELDRARGETADPQQARNLEQAVEHLEEAHIGTIHSFCAEILRERPVEAVVDPAFGELSELEAPRLYRQVFRRWMQEKLDEDSPTLRRALSRMAAREWDERTPMQQLEDAGWKLIEWRDFRGDWKRQPFEREARIDELVSAVQALDAMAARCRRSRNNLKSALEPAANLATWIARAEAVRPRDYDTLEGLLAKLLSDLKRNTRKGSGFFAEGVTREAVLEAREAVLRDLEAFRVAADADLAALLHAELSELIPRYDEAKRRAGGLDFLDLLIRVRDLVRDRPDVRAYLQERFTHIFVDEFQDTDPLQVELLVLLSADSPEASTWSDVTPVPGKLFLVGDPKQSIYRFRRADVMLYRAVTDALTERGVKLVHLRKSFRAIRPIQQAINAAFAPEMTGDAATGQPDYVPLEEHATSSEPRPALVALPVPKPYGKMKISRGAIEDNLHDAIAAFVEWLIRDSGWTVRDQEDGARVPVSPRHVCLLFRRFLSYGEDVTRDYTRSLEARGIPHLLVGARSFHQREEVETVRAALAAIEWPDDELSVFATLKGSFFAVSDSVLLRFRHQFGLLHPFRRLPEDLEECFRPVREALGLLADLHRRRNREPIVSTLSALLEATRAHAGFALRPNGHQVLANVNRVCDLARAFELTGGISFRGLVEELAEQAARVESAEAPVLEEGAEGVRIMTVHTAKGLEFPVVILADMTAHLVSWQPERHVDPERNVCAQRLLGCTPWDLLEHQPEEAGRDRAEGVRIAYVAATRARDLLVVPAVGDEPLEGWLAPLNKALYPPLGRARRSAAAPGCPNLGEDTTLVRPPEFARAPETAVKPGLHQFSDYGVVWWDPRLLRLDVEGTFGLRQEEILAEDEGGAAASGGTRRYEEWKARSARLVEQGSRPQFELFLATQAAELPAGWTPATEVATIERTPGRPSGPRFGTLVHTLLRDALPGRDLAALARVHGRVLGASRAEIDAALEAVRAALHHPLMARAATAERCHREWPVTLKLDGGKLFEGVIDLAFFEDHTWIVLDFKTDAELALARYRRQLEWYAYAVARITGQPARGWLLSV